ncbi:MAG: response regulator [Desulfobacterales bacterium]|nr:response regulator [Desulfobacterales bacterium]
MRKVKTDRKYSIAFMLTSSILATIVLVSSIAISISYIKATENAKNSLERDITKNLTEITDILEMPLWAYDSETIEDIGKLYSRNESIVKLKIIDSLGITLFETDKKDKGNTLGKRASVFHNNKIAGTVEVVLSASKYEEAIEQILSSGSVTLLINLTVLLILTGFFLRRFLNKPLNRLSDIVNSYSLEKYSSEDFKMPYKEFVPVVNVIQSMSLKITEQIEDLKAAKKKYSDIFENAVEGIFQFGTDNKFIDVNPAMAKIFGYKNPKDLIDNQKAAPFLKSKGVLGLIKKELDQNNIIETYEFEGLNKEGVTIWLSMSAKTVKDANGKIIYYEGSLKNISDLKEKKRAERKQKEADAANRAKTNFLAKMSHEIRTPLNSILGMAELLEHTKCNKDQTEYINVLQSSGEFLQVIINDILDFSKIEADQLDLEVIPFNIINIVEDVINIFSTGNRNVTVSFKFINNIEHILLGDPVRIRQVLINLVGNAVKFTKKGSIKIEIDPKEISENKIKTEFKIIDTGIGIDKSKLEMIFQSFSQADSFTNRQYGGTGLGLAISRRLVEAMGGTLNVKSKINEGSVFFFTLEFSISDLIKKVSFSETEEIKTIPELKILLADDIEPNRTVIHKYLQDFPVKIIDADNGEIAFDLFKKEKFDLILMDVEMPVMNGLTATKAIRKLEKENSAPAVPLIIISAHAFGEQKLKCFEAGCDRLIVKPVRRAELINNISDIFQISDRIERIADTKKVEDIPKNNNEEANIIYIDNIFEDLIPDFFIYFKETLEVMDKALLARNFDDLYRLGHGLKGSSRNYELYDLGEIFMSIEHASEKKSITDITLKMNEARKYINKINVEFIQKD